MPLGGKLIKDFDSQAFSPLKEGTTIALELLLRVIQRSDAGPIMRAAAENSLLLVLMPFDLMQQQLPSLKADWLNTGDTKNLVLRLQDFSRGIWGLSYVRYQGLSLVNFWMLKINFYHTLIFFKLTICISAFEYIRNNDLLIFSLFLILCIGISHGSLDNLKGKKLLKYYNINSISIF